MLIVLIFKRGEAKFMTQIFSLHMNFSDSFYVV